LGNWLFLAQLDLFKGAALGEPSPSQQERKKRGVGREEIHNLDVLLRHDAGDAPAGQPQSPQHLALQPATSHLPCLLLLCSGKVTVLNIMKKMIENILKIFENMLNIMKKE